MMKSVKPWMVLLIIQLLLQGCGGGGGSSDNPADTNDPVISDNPVDTTSVGYTGSEEQAVVNESNAKNLATNNGISNTYRC
ncbi:MAG: hypothetical protein ABW096_02430 [Candidatus Thiodiazotropha sp.]